MWTFSKHSPNFVPPLDFLPPSVPQALSETEESGLSLPVTQGERFCQSRKVLTRKNDFF